MTTARVSVAFALAKRAVQGAEDSTFNTSDKTPSDE
jgi:hypothetical protein